MNIMTVQDLEVSLVSSYHYPFFGAWNWIWLYYLLQKVF
ncbi:hypothetical protein J2T56_002016 [Natronobacillus azotifigens]